MSRLEIAYQSTNDPGLTLPLDIVTETIGILAIKGSGKTYTFMVIAEEMIKRNLPVIIIDTMGVCWGLRSSVDGKKPGFQVVILGGSHGDVPLESTAGKVIAEWIVSERQPAVLDLSEFSKAESLRFMLDFASTLFQKNREAIHVIIDEADMFAPQRPFSEEARTLRAVEVLVRRGRARGIGVTLVTQRPATLSKDVLTQVGLLIVGRMISPQDRKAVQAWIDAHGTEHQKEAFWDSLASLSTKEKWIWAPVRNIFKRVTIRPRETFDSSATPRVGEKVSAPKSLAEVDLESLKGKIAATIEKAKQEDPRELRRQLSEMTKLYQKSMGSTSVKVEIPVEIPVLSDEQIAKIEDVTKGMIVICERLHGLQQEISGAARDVSAALTQWAQRGKLERVTRNLTSSVPKVKNPLYEFRSAPAQRSDSPAPADLGKGERIILQAIAQYPAGASREQLTILTGYRRSSRDTYLQRLSQRNYVRSGTNGNLVATEEGLSTLGNDHQPLPTGAELRSYWLNRLTGGEQIILEQTLRAYPAAVHRESLSEETGYKRSSRDTYIQRLAARKLIEVGRSTIRAADTLFEE